MRKRNWVLGFIVAAVLLSSQPGFAASIDPEASEVVALWPDLSSGVAYERMDDTGDGVIRITNVSNPTLAFYPAGNTDTPKPTVLVCPGGGYGKLAYNKEGTEVAEWLNGLGVSAAVLKYRVPNDRDGALADAQRAMGILRDRAATWHVDPGKVGVLGFSAGGHLAARLSTTTTARTYEGVDSADEQSCRPDFTVLIYPAYIAKDRYDAAPEISVDSQTPPAFILQTQDDTHYINSSVAYYIALKDAGVAAEMHLFPVGGHGYGLRASDDAVSGWPALCARWFKTAGVLP